LAMHGDRGGESKKSDGQALTAHGNGTHFAG